MFLLKLATVGPIHTEQWSLQHFIIHMLRRYRQC